MLMVLCCCEHCCIFFVLFCSVVQGFDLMVLVLTLNYFMLILMVASFDTFFNHVSCSPHDVEYATDVDIIIFHRVPATYFLKQTPDSYYIFANTKHTNKCINDILDEFEMIEQCKQLHILGKSNNYYNENYQQNGLTLQGENKSNDKNSNVTTFKARKRHNAQDNNRQYHEWERY